MFVLHEHDLKYQSSYVGMKKESRLIRNELEPDVKPVWSYTANPLQAAGWTLTSNTTDLWVGSSWLTADIKQKQYCWKNREKIAKDGFSSNTQSLHIKDQTCSTKRSSITLSGRLFSLPPSLLFAISCRLCFLSACRPQGFLCSFSPHSELLLFAISFLSL